jgi:hypothetical protein
MFPEFKPIVSARNGIIFGNFPGEKLPDFPQYHSPFVTVNFRGKLMFVRKLEFINLPRWKKSKNPGLWPP